VQQSFRGFGRFANDQHCGHIAVAGAPVKAYGVTQVWLQLAVSRFLAWLYWTCTYRYVGALVSWLLT
jgi:hypothetical protein